MTWALLCVPLMAIACGGGATQTTPSTAPPTISDLAGTWAGTFDAYPPNQTCFGVTWSPTQAASGGTGPASIKPVPGPYDQTGTITATPNGIGWDVRFSFPAPAFRPQSLTCEMSGSGFIRPRTTNLSGDVTVQWSSTCRGNVFLGSMSDTFPGLLTLSKGTTPPAGC